MATDSTAKVANPKLVELSAVRKFSALELIG